MVVRFETMRVEENIRSEIVIKILDDFAEKDVWISQSINRVDLIAKFGQSVRVCKYLIDQIVTSANFRAQYNALSVLSEFTELYGLEETIRNSLFYALKSDNVRYHEKQKILDSVTSLKLQTNEITDYIVGSYSIELDSQYRTGVLRYLYGLNLHEKYIDIFLDEYKLMDILTESPRSKMERGLSLYNLNTARWSANTVFICFLVKCI